MNNYNTQVLERCKTVIENYKINITEDDVFQFLKIRKRWPVRYRETNIPSVEVITQGHSVEQHNYICGPDNFLDFNLVMKYYNLGYTILLSDVLDLTEELRSLENKLIDMTGNFPIHANFYFGKAVKDIRPSFEYHAHDYNIVSKQIYGTNYWVINDEQITVEKNKAITIPKNTNHMVYHSEIKTKISKGNYLQDTRRLSLTINL